MRLIAILTVLALSLGYAGVAMADDEFGSRFSADSPSALEDPAKALADIMPAAGEEEEEADDHYDNDEQSPSPDEAPADQSAE